MLKTSSYSYIIAGKNSLLGSVTYLTFDTYHRRTASPDHTPDPYPSPYHTPNRSPSHIPDASPYHTPSPYHSTDRHPYLTYVDPKTVTIAPLPPKKPIYLWSVQSSKVLLGKGTQRSPTQSWIPMSVGNNEVKYRCNVFVSWCKRRTFSFHLLVVHFLLS